jgi:uncharacterized protein (DUF362 family)
MRFSRRFFLYLSGLSFLSYFSIKFGSKVKQLLSRPKFKTIDARKFKNPYNSQGKALVSMVGGNSIRAMVEEAVALIGGFDKIGVKDKTILVKPNAVTGDPNPTTTNPKVLKAVVEFLYDEGAKKVVAGDMSALLTISTAKNMERTGLTKVAVEAGADVVQFDDYDWVDVKLPDAKYLQKVYVSEWIYKADRVINLPVIKTHKYATYSICLKNFIGATHLKQRPYFIDKNHWAEVISDINLAYTPHLNIVDGTTSMVAGGPRKGTAASTNVILASGDRVAADVVGLAIIKSYGKWPRVVKRDVWQQRQVIRALDLGLGAKKGRIALMYRALEGHNRDFAELVARVKEYVGVV